jgi:hypothetical protein
MTTRLTPLPVSPSRTNPRMRRRTTSWRARIVAAAAAVRGAPRATEVERVETAVAAAEPVPELVLVPAVAGFRVPELVPVPAVAGSRALVPVRELELEQLELELELELEPESELEPEPEPELEPDGPAMARARVGARARVTPRQARMPQMTRASELST